MWKPNDEGLKELINLFKDYNSNDNTKQKQIFYKIAEYSAHKEFPNYLVYILNSKNLTEIRQVAGLSLKGIMERSFNSMPEEILEYFKENILTSYLDEDIKIRKTISNLINAFICHGGMEMWPEILNFLLLNLETSIGVEMSLETLNIIIEDSGTYLEEKFNKFLALLLIKLISFLDDTGRKKTEERNEKLIILVLTTMYFLLESCPNTMNEQLENITRVLVSLQDSLSLQIRYHLGRCWLTIVRMNKETFSSNKTLIQIVFPFFMNNFSVEYYEMNFISAEFFLILVEKEENEVNQIKYEQVANLLQDNLKELVNYLLHYMKLTEKDISGMDNKYKENAVKKSEDENEKNVNENEDEELEEELEGYNPNWTLRKCCSKILDQLGILFSQKLYEIVKPILENDMQHQDWQIKERSILALGAVAVGLISLLKPCLSTIISYLIRELEYPQKLVRAISCWTLSRFTKFILIDNLSENSFNIFKDYLCEVLKKFLDKEIIVQEAACTAFSTMVITKKEKLEPYLFDIFKIISSVFNQYTGTSLLTLYDIISLLTEYFPEHFENPILIEEVVNCVNKRWYDLIKTNDFKHISPIFEMISSIIKVSKKYCSQFVEYFLNGSLIIIENNYNLFISNKNDINFLDKELLSRSIDLISLLCQCYPTQIKENPNKAKIVDYFFKLLETNDSYLKHYLIAMVCDLGKEDNNVLTARFDEILNIIFVNLDFPENNTEIEKISICNNSCWSMGLLALQYPEQVRANIIPILKKMLKIMSLPILNKSLAQNISICIGRLALIDPQNISNYLDSFLKQFCLSLRFIKDSPEKREAFGGLCKAILLNPNGVMNCFAFFCDAICQYDDPPEELENLFQNIIMSYKNTLREKWMDFFKLFPDKLKVKMTNRFKLA